MSYFHTFILFHYPFFHFSSFLLPFYFSIFLYFRFLSLPICLYSSASLAQAVYLLLSYILFLSIFFLSYLRFSLYLSFLFCLSLTADVLLFFLPSLSLNCFGIFNFIMSSLNCVFFL